MSPHDELERLRADVSRLTAEKAALAVEAAQMKAEVERATRLAERVSREKAKLEATVARLQRERDELSHRLFGRSSEKVDPNQLLLAFALEEAREEAETSTGPTPPHVGEAPDGEVAPKPPRRGNGHGRRRPPTTLPRERVVHEPAPEDLLCDCCGSTKVPSGLEEVTERLDYVPASLRIVEHVRPKYRCTTCQGEFVVAPAASGPIEKGLAEPGLLAYVVTSKYADHLPLNRQQAILSREGFYLHRSTLCDWTDDTAASLQGVAEQVLREILTHVVVGVDDTGIRVIFDKKDQENGTRNARIWAYRGRVGELFFTYSETKKADDARGPKVKLRGYRGYVQADAAGTFDDLFVSGERLEVGCNAHARRKFFHAKDTEPIPAAYALTAYQRVYEIENRFCASPADERRAARQAETKPILERLYAYLDEIVAANQVAPGMPLATAITYARNHRVALCRFLEDGQLSPDNNAVERALRLVAVGRKNWLFAGSEQAAENAGILYTLVGSCRELGLNTFEYMRDVISRVRSHPPDRLVELTPRRWAIARGLSLPPDR